MIVQNSVLSRFFNVFYVFENPKRDFYVFLALLHTFSRTMNCSFGWCLARGLRINGNKDQCSPIWALVAREGL